MTRDEMVDMLVCFREHVEDLIKNRISVLGLDLDARTIMWCVGQLMCSGKTLQESLGLLGLKEE